MFRQQLQTISIAVLFIAGVLALSLMTAHFADWVSLAGVNIPQNDLSADYLKAMIWGVILAGFLLVSPVPSTHKIALLNLWGAKLFIALGFMLVYEQHYGLDSYMYFDEARQGAFSFKYFELGQGTNNVINLARLQQMLIPDSYHAMKLTSAMIGLIAIYIFYRATTLYLGHEQLSALYIIGLFPGVLFWSSILGKDPLVLLGVAIYSFGVVGWLQRAKWHYLLWLVAGLLLSSLIRVWLGQIMLVPLAVVLVTRTGHPVMRVLFVAVMATVFLYFQEAFQNKFQIENYHDLFDAAQGVSSAWAEGGSGQSINVQFTGLSSFVRFAPIGIFTALFRPLPGEILNLFGILASLEDVALLTLLFFALRRTRLRDFSDPVVLWASLFLLVWGSVYGIVSYQNLGTAVRFKLQILPVLVLLLLHLARRREPSTIMPAV